NNTVSNPSLYTVKNDNIEKTITLPVVVACQTFAFTNSIHFLVSTLFNIQKLTQNNTATADIPAIASFNSLGAPVMSITNCAINHVMTVAITDITIPRETFFL